MRQYIGLIRKDPDSDYGVCFPDFPGCVSAGSTLDEARDMAAEALAFHIEGMEQDGEAIPEPATLETIMADPLNRDAVAILVPTPTRAVRAVRINITLPEDVPVPTAKRLSKTIPTRAPKAVSSAPSHILNSLVLQLSK